MSHLIVYRHLTVARALAAGLNELRLVSQYAATSLKNRISLAYVNRDSADAADPVYPSQYDLCLAVVTQYNRLRDLVKAFEGDEVDAQAPALTVFNSKVGTPVLFALHRCERFHKTGDSFSDEEVVGAYEMLHKLTYSLHCELVNGVTWG